MIWWTDLTIPLMSCSLILGPVSSGKTTELCHRLKVEADTGAKVIYINHSHDNRNGKVEISTHNSQLAYERDGIYKIKVPHLTEVTAEVLNYEVIGIDEGQFFTDIDSFVRNMVLNHDKTVIIAGLNGDYKLNVFGEIYKLIPICAAGQITNLGGRCIQCLKRGKMRNESIGSFSSLKDVSTSGASEFADGGNIKIGGTDIYTSACLSCYKRLNKV